MSGSFSGTIIKRSSPHRSPHKTTHTVEQGPLSTSTWITNHIGERYFDYSSGPLALKGTAKTTSSELHVDVSVLGIYLGRFDSDQDGTMAIQIDLFAAKGVLMFDRKDAFDTDFELKGLKDLGDVDEGETEEEEDTGIWLKWEIQLAFDDKRYGNIVNILLEEDLVRNAAGRTLLKFSNDGAKGDFGRYHTTDTENKLA